MKNRLHFSLAGLLGAVAFVAVGCAALRYASDWWASGVLTLAVGLLLGGTLALFLRPGRPRAFWAGFALFGWAYLLLCFGPWIGSAMGPRLITTRFFQWLEPKFRTTGDPVPWGNSPGLVYSNNNGGAPGSGTSVVWDIAGQSLPPAVPAWNSFQSAGHSWFALLAAFAGGLLGARCLAAADRQEKAGNGGHP